MRKQRGIEILIVIAAIALVAAILWPSIERSRLTGGGRQRCPSNLRQIGTALTIYGMENDRSFPPSFAVLIQTQDLTPGVFICPDGHAHAAATKTAFQGTRADCSYLYLGDGLTMDAHANVLLAIDRAENHDPDGVNALFCDGRVGWIPTREEGGGAELPWWVDVQSQIARHDRPVCMPPSATQPATRPATR